MSNNSIWPIDKTLSGATIFSKSGPGSHGNKELIRIPQSSCITDRKTYHWEEIFRLGLLILDSVNIRTTELQQWR